MMQTNRMVSFCMLFIFMFLVCEQLKALVVAAALELGEPTTYAPAPLLRVRKAMPYRLRVGDPYRCGWAGKTGLIKPINP